MTTPRSSREVERKRKRQHWNHHLLRWRQSGLSQAEYCRRHQLSIKCFVYWKSRLGRSDPSIKLVAVPVSQAMEPKQSSELALVVGDRFRVEVKDGFNPETFEKLLRVLSRI